jgi:hypothetical protein
MRLHDEETLSAEAERELEALDAALAGRPVDPRLEHMARLARELRAERPEPRPEFSAELDERAAAGFPPSAAGGRLGAIRGAARDSRIGRWLATRPPRRLLAPAGAAATLLVVAGVAISQSGIGGDADEAVEPAEPSTALEQAGDSAAKQTEAIEPAPAPGPIAPPFPGPPGLAPGQTERKVERTAQITLSTEGNEVASVADEVIAVADRYRGIVVSSQIVGEEGDRARAGLELAIPAGRLDEALRDLSEIADVESRSESTLDVTEPFVTARERLADARAELESLLAQLADADSPKETASIRRRMEIVRDEIARARTELESVARRARFARVSVTVQGDGQSGDWSFEDAVDDAGDVLGFAAKVTLVSLAVLAPLALLVAIAWLGGRALARHRRERALD